MNGGDISLTGQLTRKRRKRNLRKCASFERGKCAECEKIETDGKECDMKETRNDSAHTKTQD